MEKRAVIEEGRTPPEAPQPGEKQAEQKELEEHITRRLQEVAELGRRKGALPAPKPGQK